MGAIAIDRPATAALASLMPQAIARFVPGPGYASFLQRRELHIRIVEAWLIGGPLPAGLEPEPPSALAVDRVLLQLPGR